MASLILASTSPFRRELLGRLGLDFQTRAPDIDETPLPGEDAETLVMRLAEAKARSVVKPDEHALVIGSDQVAVLDADILGKPGTVEGAVAQLGRCSGRRVGFVTGLCLLNAVGGRCHLSAEDYAVHFRDLDEARIQRYVAREKPLNCAGSFKMEGLGISLFTRLEGQDPNILVGLPLIRLVDFLAREGIQIP